MAEDNRGEPLEGEIVPWDSPEPPPDTEGRRERKWGYPIDEDTVRAAVRDRTAGMPTKVVAQKYGISHETVRRWCGDAVMARRYTPEQLGEIRAALALEYEVAASFCWDMVRAAPLSKLALEALGRIDSLTSNRAKLLGAIAPVRVDAQVHLVTEAERELQEMINEANAKTAVDEARVIAEAGADEEL
jgi:hypothetical protein